MQNRIDDLVARLIEDSRTTLTLHSDLCKGEGFNEERAALHKLFDYLGIAILRLKYPRGVL